MFLVHRSDLKTDFLVFHLNNIVGNKALFLLELLLTLRIKAQESHGEHNGVLNIFTVLEFD